MTIAEVADRVRKVRAGYGAQVYGLQEGDRAGLSGQYQSDATLLANNCLAACQAVADLQDDQMPSDPVEAIGYLVDLNAEVVEKKLTREQLGLILIALRESNRHLSHNSIEFPDLEECCLIAIGLNEEIIQILEAERKRLKPGGGQSLCES